MQSPPAVAIALLRAVNVAGRGKIAMTRLRDCLVTMGFWDVVTILQSGNILFGAKSDADAALEAKLEAEFSKQFALKTVVMVRSAAQWRRLVTGNPFPEEAERDPSHLLAFVTKHPVTKPALEALRSAIERTNGPETLRANSSGIYIMFPAGIGRSRVTTALVEKSLGTPVTARNWNTVLKLNDVCEGREELKVTRLFASPLTRAPDCRPRGSHGNTD